MTLSAAPFFSFAAFADTANGRVIVSWAVIEGLDVAKVRVEREVAAVFTLVDTVPATDSRIIDPEGKDGDRYRLVGEAADGELWVPTDPFTADDSLEPVCELSGILEDVKGSPVFDKPVQILALPLEGISPNKRAVTEDTVETRTDALGRWRLTLIQGLRVRLEIPDANVSFPTVIPEKGKADFSELEILEGQYIRIS